MKEELQIIDLDQDNVNRFAPDIPKMAVVFIAFLAPWCGHCKSFKPEWEKAKKHLKLKRKKMKGYIITASDTTMKHLPIKQPSGFPTMSLYKSGKHIEDYTGGRNMEEVVAFLEKHMKKQAEKQQRGGFGPALSMTLVSGLRRSAIERAKTRRKQHFARTMRNKTRFGRRTRNRYRPKLSKIAEGIRTRKGKKKRKRKTRTRLRRRRRKRGIKRRKRR